MEKKLLLNNPPKVKWNRKESFSVIAGLGNISTVDVSRIYSYNDSYDGPVTRGGVSKGQCSALSSQPTKHFIMTKIEKTGSTTLYSILGRFLLRNKLNIASQSKAFHIHWTKQKLGEGEYTVISLIGSVNRSIIDVS